MNKADRMEKVRRGVFNLKKSPLYAYRKANNYIPVIGEGNIDADIVFIGEAPGRNEAESGKPFCGASGRVLNELLEHVGISREDVYITNIVKDRPQDNRDPSPEEIELYAPFLDTQIEIIEPKVIATLGRFSMEYVMRRYGLESEIGVISSVHGKKFLTKIGEKEVYIVPLYHPAASIYNQKLRGELKKDIKIIKKCI